MRIGWKVHRLTKILSNGDYFQDSPLCSLPISSISVAVHGSHWSKTSSTWTFQPTLAFPHSPCQSLLPVQGILSCNQLISVKLPAFSLLLRLHLFANELFFHFLQPPTVETETIKFNPDLTETPISTKNVPIVKTETRKVSYQKDGLDGHRESEEGVLVSSQAHSSKTQTIETTTVSPTPPPHHHNHHVIILLHSHLIDARYFALLIILTCAPPLVSRCGHLLVQLTKAAFLSLISFIFTYIYFFFTYIYIFFFCMVICILWYPSMLWQLVTWWMDRVFFNILHFIYFFF